MAIKGMNIEDTKLAKLVRERIRSNRLRTEIFTNLYHVWDHGKGLGAWTIDTYFLGEAFTFSETQQGHEYWCKVCDLLHGKDSLRVVHPTK